MDAMSVTVRTTDPGCRVPLSRWFPRACRGPLLAALLALIVGLPAPCWPAAARPRRIALCAGLAQMLESRRLYPINVQDVPRYKKPVGIHWLQARVSVAAVAPESGRSGPIACRRCSARRWRPAAWPGARGRSSARLRPAGRGDAGDQPHALHRGLLRQDRRGAMRPDHPGDGGAGADPCARAISPRMTPSRKCCA